MFKKTHSIIAITLTSLLLVSCSTITIATSIINLDTTPTTEASISFNVDENEVNNVGLSSDSTYKTTSTTYYVASNDSCYFSASINYVSSYFSGFGDEFLSLNGLWLSMGNSDTLSFSRLENTYINVTGSSKKLETVTGTWEENDSYDYPYNLVAVRGIDSLENTPTMDENSIETVGNNFGSDPSKSLPILVIQYSCYDEVNQNIFNQLLKTVTVNGINDNN